MAEQQKKDPSQSDADLQREIRNERKFSLSEAIGRLAGPGAMKGASPVTRKRQAELEIDEYLKQHLADPAGALRLVLFRHIEGSEFLLSNLDQPAVVVLAACIRRALDSDFLLKEIVRDADVEWGRMCGERPYFDPEGCAPHPDDPYTFDSVGAALSQLIENLETRLA